MTTSTRTPTLAELTTLRVGGPAGRYVETSSEADLIEAVRSADDAGEPLLVLGGGSNVLVSDAGFDGVVVRDLRTGVTTPDHSACAGVTVVVPAGTPWDDVVAQAVGTRLYGVEALSGIPGSTGATPVQNVGAYGQDVAQSIATVRTWVRARGRVRTLAFGELAFGYRASLLKRSMRADASVPRSPWSPTPRYVVLEVTQEVNLATTEVQFNAPVISTRQVQTQLLIKDGHTVALGGLSDREKDSSQGGVPLLSSIPFIGGLFGHVSRTSAQTELFLFLTPHVIRTDDEADSLTAPMIDKSHEVTP